MWAKVVVEGEYHWHQHETDDEFFYVVEGQLLSILNPARSHSILAKVSLCRGK